MINFNNLRKRGLASFVALIFCLNVLLPNFAFADDAEMIGQTIGEQTSESLTIENPSTDTIPTQQSQPRLVLMLVH